MAHFNFAHRPEAVCVALGLTDTTAFKAWFPSFNDAAYSMDPFYGTFPPGYMSDPVDHYITCFGPLRIAAALIRMEVRCSAWQWRADVDCALFRLSLTRPEEF